MFVSRHNLPPAVTMQNAVYLSITDLVVNFRLVCLGYFLDIRAQLSPEAVEEWLFLPLGSYFMVTAVVVACYAFKTVMYITLKRERLHMQNGIPLLSLSILQLCPLPVAFISAACSSAISYFGCFAMLHHLCALQHTLRLFDCIVFCTLNSRTLKFFLKTKRDSSPKIGRLSQFLIRYLKVILKMLHTTIE